MVSNGLIRLPEGVHFFQRGWLSSNNALLIDKEQAILIDTGYHTHAPQTLDLVNHQLYGRPLTSIINTHLHSDHCGGNAHMQDAFPNAVTWIPPGHANYVRNWDPLVLGYIGTGQHCPAFKAHKVLTVGQEFLVGGISWHCLAAPGHDPHSFILFSPDTGICITADALWENGFGVIFPEIEGEEGFDDVGSSLDLIESLSPSIIFPGHGASFTDVSGALERARARLSRFIDKPDSHALYAAKVLVKFKLLELQRIEKQIFRTWAFTATHLEKIHRAHFINQSFVDWFDFVCNDLVRSGAATFEGNHLLNA
jgi:glyoxylase-like metal-dependent hydrolase (beta-lactamase superfamily II)